MLHCLGHLLCTLAAGAGACFWPVHVCANQPLTSSTLLPTRPLPPGAPWTSTGGGFVLNAPHMDGSPYKTEKYKHL
jgi:hypothetical protein